MSKKLCIPEKVLDQHLVVLGKTGSGKSSALRHVVEHLLSRNKRVCVIDPKGDWWGLKVSGDGRGPGFPVILFGDFKQEDAGDVPINDRSGKHIAELVASGNRPCVIGMRGWTHAAMTRFWIDFAAALFAGNAGELYVVGDEFHNFAPKGKVLSPQAGESLHWSNRLLSEGRGLGLVCLLASQRPQKVHNDTLTSCETLVAMRVIHKADRDAVKDWIDGAGDPKLGTEVLNALAAMPRGEAYVWSPEAGFGPERIAFPLFTTFDSFAPPQLQKKVSGKGWADVDLTAVKEKLAAVIEEEKAKDPAELKKKIAEQARRIQELERAAAKPQAAAPGKEKRVEVPILKDAQIQRLERHADRLDAMLMEFDGRIENVKQAMEPTWQKILETRDQLRTESSDMRNSIRLAKAPAAPATPARLNGPSAGRVAPPAAVSRPVRAPRPPARSGEGEGEPSLGNSGKRRILIALAQNPDGVNDRKLSILTDIAKGGGTWRTYMAELRGAGWIDGDRSNLRITQAGVDALGEFEPLPTGQALIDYWRGRLGASGKRAIFDACVAAYPNAVTKEDLGEQTGIAVGGGTWRTYMAELRGLELIEGHKEIRASDVLFET